MLAATRLRLSAALGAVLFIVGYLIVLRVPGGADVKGTDFAKFYDSDGKMAQALLMEVALVLATIALAWFFIELRAALGTGVLAQLGGTLGTLGVVTVAIGGALLLGPVAVQLISDAPFVGVPIAQTFAQAGFVVTLLIGMGLIAASTILVSLAMGRAGLIPSWLRIVGIVAGVITLGSVIALPGLIFPIWLLILAAVGPGKSAKPAA